MIVRKPPPRPKKPVKLSAGSLAVAAPSLGRPLMAVTSVQVVRLSASGAAVMPSIGAASMTISSKPK